MTATINASTTAGVVTTADTSGILQLQTNGTAALTVDASQNVGIGTSSGSARLNVNGGTSTSQIRWEVNNAAFTQEVSTNAAASAYVYKSNDASYHVWKLSSSEAMRIDSSGNVGIGTSSPGVRLDVQGTAAAAYVGQSLTNGSSTGYVQQALKVGASGANGSAGTFYAPTLFYKIGVVGNDTTTPITFVNNNDTERARIDSSGSLLVGKTASSFATAGVEINAGGGNFCRFTRDGGALADFNRLTNDGELVGFWQATTQEGSISVSGSTVSYNGGHLSRWAQTTTAKDDTLVKGTVLSNLDEMNVYVAPTTYWAEKDELPEGVSVGDVKAETHSVDNEQLNKVKVSDVEGDANVAGVFVNWTHDDAHDVDEINMAMTGDMIIRIAQGTTVARGDLLMSAGDGTAKPQGDDIVRSKTVAKVTSTHVTCTYADGSYCVPCVLMAC